MSPGWFPQIRWTNVGRALAPPRPEKRRFRRPPRERRRAGRGQDAVSAARLYRRSVTRRTQVFDAALAAVLLLLGQAEAWGGVFSSELTGPRWALATAYAICAVALVFRRRDPLAVALVIAAVFIAEFAAFGSSEGLGTFLIPLIAAYTLGGGSSPRRALIGLAALLAMGAVWDGLDPSDDGRLTEHVGQVIWLTPWVVAFLFGLYWRSRQLNLDQAARVQAGRAERAVAEERTRIARELHDAIGHSVAVMTVQTSAVRRLLHGDQGKERAALETVEATGREAMAEMRKIVGVLRSGEEAPDLAPPPSLAQLDRLADNFRHAGLVVDVEVAGDTAAVAPGLSATVYRLVQESLTNALKHAAARRVQVLIECREDRLEVTVTDDGRGGAADPAKGAGLTGMRERVKVYGGTLLAGPAAGGGFTVHAVLPAGPS
jgi:signal transduction histidine kinase